MDRTRKLTRSMACFGRHGDKKRRPGFFDRASPAFKEIMLRLHRAQKPVEIDHHFYEFGSVEYHIQSATSDPQIIHVSISTPIMSPEISVPYELPSYTIEMVRRINPDAVSVIDPPRQGYHLTLELNMTNIPQGKEGIKMIKEIAAIQSVILSSQLKQLLRFDSYTSQNHASQVTFKPIKLVYHPNEPFFLIRQPHKISVVYPMRFRESSDLLIATSFFQELMEVGSSEEWAKAPPCTWSPIPPPELRGEPIDELSTNGGFLSLDIFSHHVDEKRLEKTLWNLLNFYTYVKSHVKSTKGYIQRRMRKRLEDLVKALHETSIDEDEPTTKISGCGWMRKPISNSRMKKLRQGYSNFSRKITRTYYRIRVQGFSDFNSKIKRIRHRIKIQGFSHIRHHWFSIPKVSAATRYTILQ